MFVNVNVMTLVKIDENEKNVNVVREDLDKQNQ